MIDAPLMSHFESDPGDRFTDKQMQHIIYYVHSTDEILTVELVGKG